MVPHRNRISNSVRRDFFQFRPAIEALETRSLLTSAVIPIIDTAQPTNTVEAEFMARNGVNMSRSNASRGVAVLLQSAQVRAMDFAVERDTSTQFSVRLSNDNWGPLEKVELYLDGKKIGEGLAPDTGDRGVGWNRFVELNIGKASLTTGIHRLEIRVTGGDGRGIELDFVKLANTPLSTTTTTIQEAEAASGTGEVRLRSSASNQRTILLKAGQTRSFRFTNQQTQNMTFIVRLSNDNWGATEKLEAYLDGTKIGETLAPDTGDRGLGWNVFAELTMAQKSVLAGSHVLEIRVTGGDGYGVELDCLKRLSRPDVSQVVASSAASPKANDQTATTSPAGARAASVKASGTNAVLRKPADEPVELQGNDVVETDFNTFSRAADAVFAEWLAQGSESLMKTR